MGLEDWTARASKARRAAHRALAKHESAASRVVLLEDLTKSLSGTPVDVQDYFSEAIACLEGKLYRSGDRPCLGGALSCVLGGLLSEV